jgi:hypothetical protein
MTGKRHGLTDESVRVWQGRAGHAHRCRFRGGRARVNGAGRGRGRGRVVASFGRRRQAGIFQSWAVYRSMSGGVRLLGTYLGTYPRVSVSDGTG